MEELKVLVGMVAELPQMALWVVALFFAYKVVVIGSIYGVIRLGIIKLHSVLTSPKRETIYTVAVSAGQTGLHAINDEARVHIEGQLSRLKGASYSYLHKSDAFRLQKAIDLLLAEERKAKEAK